MGALHRIKRWLNMIFFAKAREEFSVKAVTSAELEAFIRYCINVYKGKPGWLDEDVRTINMAKVICSETARLATLAISVTIDGSARAEWLQGQVDRWYYNIRHWAEYGAECGTVILKPNHIDQRNGNVSIDAITPDKFMITQTEDGNITGCVFYDSRRSTDGETWYTRLEYHRYLDDGRYAINNLCYKGESKTDLSMRIAIEASPWEGIDDEVIINDLPQPLFAVLRMPAANSIDIDSPLGMPVFADALEELRDLDIAYSRLTEEIDDSRKIILLDSDRMTTAKGKIARTSYELEHARETMKLPKYVRNVTGDGTETFYKEIQPSINTVDRLTGMNAILAQIGFKCGFSNGYFSFNEKTGLVTATQIEAEEQRTIQFIKDVRDKLEDALCDLIAAADEIADLYDLAPAGEYNTEEMLHFADITYNFEEDRAFHYQLALQGRYPWDEYYVKFMRYSREEAEELLQRAQEATRAQQAQPGLFAGQI